MNWVDVVTNLFAAFGGVCAALGGYVAWSESRDKRNRKPTEAQLLRAAGRVIRQASDARRNVHQLQLDEWNYAYARALGLPPLEAHGPSLAGAPTADYRRRLRLGASTEPVGQVVARGVLTPKQAAAIRQAFLQADVPRMSDPYNLTDDLRRIAAESAERVITSMTYGQLEPTLMHSDGRHVMERCGCRLCQRHRVMLQRFSGGGVV